MDGRLIAAVVLLPSLSLAQAPPVGAPPPADTVPKLEFAFEERVTLAPAVVLGETALGARQYIPITGGTIAGPKFKGQVVPGGWDFQLGYASGCRFLSADYFIKADDGTVIHVLNEGLGCPAAGERAFYRPKLEAPKGAHEWMTRATFVATIEVEAPTTAPPAGTPAKLEAIRIRFYQVK